MDAKVLEDISNDQADAEEDEHGLQPVKHASHESGQRLPEG